MKGGTRAPPRPSGSPPRRLERQPYERGRHRRDPRAPGPIGGHAIASYTRRPTSRNGHDAFLDHLRGRADPDPCAGGRFSSTDAPGSRRTDGVGGSRRSIIASAPAWPPFPRRLALRTSAPPTPTGPTASSRCPGRSKRSAPRSSTERRRHDLHGHDRPSRPATEFRRSAPHVPTTPPAGG